MSLNAFHFTVKLAELIEILFVYFSLDFNYECSFPSENLDRHKFSLLRGLRKLN